MKVRGGLLIKKLDGLSGVKKMSDLISEGNTRATAVFIIKYLNSLGYKVNNQPFAENSWYFRNALVRANYNNLPAGVAADSRFLEAFFGNLLLGENNELKNRFMHLDWVAERDNMLSSGGTEQATEQVARLLKVLSLCRDHLRIGFALPTTILRCSDTYAFDLPIITPLVGVAIAVPFK